jgi:hypothetical protein
MSFPNNVVFEDKVLSATNDLTFPLHFGLKQIYVRDCYERLYNHAMTEWSLDQAVFVSGTPGVGKSFFLNYVFLRLLGEGKKVLFIKMGTNEAKVYSDFDSDPPSMKVAEGLSPDVVDSVDFVLIDPPQEAGRSQEIALDHLRAKKFMVALSPDPENCKDLTKEADNDGWYYMGPASLEEANHMRVRLYSSVPQTIFDSRFQLAGGIPRFLFKTWRQGRGADKTLKKIQEKQTAAIADVIRGPRRIDAVSVPSQFQHLWYLYHLVPADDYTSYTIEICGLEPYAKLRQRLLDFNVRQLWDMFRQTDDQMGTLRGLRYEAYVHKRILAHGLDAVALKLGDSNLLSANVLENILNVQIPSTATRVVLENNGVTHQLVTAIQTARTKAAGGYLLPRLPNYPVIDSAYAPPTGAPAALQLSLQMNAGNSKPLSADKAASIMLNLGATFVVVTPYDYVVKKRLPGPAGLQQYLLVLNEDVTVGTEDPMEE